MAYITGQILSASQLNADQAATAAVAAAAVPFDDPTNVSGLGAPAILRGTVEAHKCASVTQGLGLSGAVRLATTAGLQAAINYAVANKKFFEIEPADYEIAGAQLTVPWSQSGFVWRGSMNSSVLQCSDNMPCLDIGDVTNTNLGGNMEFDGVGVGYRNSQTGNTGALAIRLGPWASSTIRHLAVNKFTAGGTNPAYVCVTETGGSFSVVNDTWNIQGGQQSIIRLTQSAATSGNIYRNIYCTVGNLNAPTALSDYAVGCSNNGITNGLFEQLNVEAVSVGAHPLLNFPGARGVVFADTHLETISLTANGAVVWAFSGSSVHIDGCSLDFRCHTADGMSGTGNFLATFGADNITCTNIQLLSQFSDSGAVNVPFQMVSAVVTGDTPASVTMRGFAIRDDTNAGLKTNVFFDANTPLANFATPRTASDYIFGYNLSKIDSAVRPVSANYTHYGSDIDATLQVPATLAGVTTITLSNQRKASGTGSTTVPIPGNTVRINRQAGSFANNLLVVNGGVAGGTLWTNSGAGTDHQFVFDGTNWAVAA
jgi:hypothetical protein